MTFSGIILAAGMSSRMENGNKLLLPFRGHTIIEETVSNMLRSSLSETIVVTGHQHDEIELALENVTDSNTCISRNDTMNFIVNQLPVIDLGSDTIICEYDTRCICDK